MITDPTMTPEEIAAKLTKAQMRAVLNGHVSYGSGYWPLYHAMREKGLVTNMLGNTLTPLGEQVRRILEGQGE